MAFAFEKLVVYQKGIEFADRACQLTEEFPQAFGFLVDQLNPASLSIAATIAEGNGWFTNPTERISSESPVVLCKSAFHCWNWHEGVNSSMTQSTWR